MEFAFVNISLQSGLSQTLEDFGDVNVMFLQTVGVDQDIVDVCTAKLIELSHQSFIDVALEGCGPISQAERQDFTLVCPVTSPKCCQFHRVRVHPNPVKRLSNINLGKYFGLGDP